MKIISEKKFGIVEFECVVCDTEFLASKSEYSIVDKIEKTETIKDSGFFPWQKGLWVITPMYLFSARCPKCGADCQGRLPAGPVRSTNKNPFFDWG